MWTAFALVNCDAPADANSGTFIPRSLEGTPDPWLPCSTVTKRGDVFIFDSRHIHHGGGKPPVAGDAGRLLLFIAIGEQPYDYELTGPVVLPKKHGPIQGGGMLHTTLGNA